MNNTIIPSQERKVPSKFQHLVLYTKNHLQSAEWYQKIFRLQFSAKNHPDSSAAMRFVNQSMFFYSFGFYHHDLALVNRPDVAPDNSSMLYFSLRLKEGESLIDLKLRLSKENIPFYEGRILKSAKKSKNLSIYFQDPINHFWIEVLEGRPETKINYSSSAIETFSADINKKHRKTPKHVLPEFLKSIGFIFKIKWVRELILLRPSLSGKRIYNKTEDFGIFKNSRCIVSSTEQITFFVTNLKSSIKWFETMGFYHTRTSSTESHPFLKGHTLKCAYFSLKNHEECTVLIEHKDEKGNIVPPTAKDSMHVAFELEGNQLEDTFTFYKQNKKLGIKNNYGPAKHNNSKPYGDGESGGNIAVYYYTPDFHNIEFFTDMDCIDNYEKRYGTRARTLENDVYLVDSK